MTGPYLEISFRHGRPFAAYIHGALPCPAAESIDLGHGLILDQDAAGGVIGIEVTDPRHADTTAIRAILAGRGVDISVADLAPLAV